MPPSTRILIKEPGRSYHTAHRVTGDLDANKLNFGDNLLSLKALEADGAGQVKCICTDPPYSIGSVLTHYDGWIAPSGSA